MKTPELVYVAPSRIHGRGLFAKTRIKRDTYIGTYEGPQAKRDGKYVLWLTDERGNATGRRGLNALRYLNHSSKPNAEFYEYDLYALKSIAPDEEITIDYGW